LAKIKTNKSEAAQRQIDAAVRMLFAGEDPLACATVAGAANRLVRDLAEHSKANRTYETLKAVIKPGMEKDFWKVYNSIPNFLKHAEKDADDVLEFEEEWIDLTLFHSAGVYRDLGFEITPEMYAITTIVVVQNPKLLTFPPEEAAKLEPVIRAFAGTSREEYLRMGPDLVRSRLGKRTP
jgi:hypothetical protein